MKGIKISFCVNDLNQEVILLSVSNGHTDYAMVISMESEMGGLDLYSGQLSFIYIVLSPWKTMSAFSSTMAKQEYIFFQHAKARVHFPSTQ